MPFILISFGVGFVLFIWFAYIIDAFFVFNFYTIYIPLIVAVSINFFIFYKYNEEFRLKFTIANLKGLFEKIKRNKMYVLVFVIVFGLAYRLFFIYVFSVYGFLSTDSYLWFYDVMYLHTKGNLDYYEVQGSSAGLLFLIAGSTLITNDFILIFTCFKYALFYLFTINLLVVFYISKKIFKNSIFVFLTLMIFLCFKEFFERAIIPIPTVIADTFGFIFLLSFEWNNDFKYTFIRGMLLGSILLCHPLIGFFYVFMYLIYELMYLFLGFKKIDKNEVEKNIMSFKIKSFLKYNTFLLLVIGLTLIPFFINQTIKNPFSGGVLSNYLHFFNLKLLNQNIYLLDLSETLVEFWEFWIIRGGRKFFSSLQNLTFFGQLFIFYNQTISYGIIFIIIGVIFKGRENSSNPQLKEYEQKFILFVKITFVVAFLYFILIGLYDIFSFSFLETIYGFLFHYKSRILEPFQGLWAILFTRAILILKQPLKKLYLFILKHKTSLKNVNHYRFGNKEKVLFYIGMIIIGAYFYTTIPHRISYVNHYEDEQIEVIWYMNEYFDSKSKKEDFNVLFSEIKPTSIFRIFGYRDNLKIFRFDMNKTSEYEDLEINNNSIDYIMIEKSIISDDLMDNISDHFDALYENSGYIFGIKK